MTYIYFTGLFHSKHMTYPAHKFHITYHISFIHTHCSYISKFHPYIYYNAKYDQDSKFHHSKLDTMQSFSKEKTSTPS